MLYYFLTVPFLVNVDLSNLGYSGNLFLYVVVAIFFGWVGYYFVRRAYLRRIGIDLDLAYKRSLRSRPIRAAKRLRAAKRSRSAGGELVAQDAIPLQID